MELSSLAEFIKYLEYGTNIHIAVVFFKNNLSEKCILQNSQRIHSKPICEAFKKNPDQFDRCLKCRNLAIRKAARDKTAFSGHCINGVFEYTHPVIFGEKVIGVISVGNILTASGEEKLRTKLSEAEKLFDTMQRDFEENNCIEIARIVEGYIITLLEKYPTESAGTNTLIENVKDYIRANSEYEISLCDVANLYFYNEVYLGRLFKEEVGKSFKEFLNEERLKRAKSLLLEGKSVIEAANKAGYNNVTYFNRVFKAQNGITPKEYKKEFAKQKGGE